MLALLLLFTAAVAEAADSVDSLGSIAEQLTRAERLAESVTGQREWNRDGLSTRVDQLLINAMQQLNDAGRLLIEATKASPVPEEPIRDQQLLGALLDRSAVLALERDKLLEQRAAAERALFEKFEQSAQADIARVFIEDLNQLRSAYLAALADQLEIRELAGLNFETLRNNLHDRLLLVIETLTGQIRLDAMSLDELRQRRSEEPLDEALQSATELVAIKQERSIEWLQRIVEIAEPVGFETAEQRSLIIRERGELAVDLLQSEVFRTLWREQLKQLRESTTRHGPDLLFRLLLFSLVLLVTWLAARLIRFVVRALVHRGQSTLSQLLRGLIVSSSSTLVYIAGLIAALSALGVSLGPLFAGLGVLGIIVGLAVQDSLGNLAAGAMILIYRPYDLEDFIGVGGSEGIVKRMNLLATTIATPNNQRLVIPNQRIWGDTIINYTASRVRRVDIEVSFAYGEDPDRVHQVLLDILEEHDKVLESPAPLVHMTGMGESAVTMKVKPWVRTEDYWDTLWDLNRAIKKRLDSEGIEIPFPQRVVTILPQDANRNQAAPDAGKGLGAPV